MSRGIDRLAEQQRLARASRGSRPVSIFIVVVLPQPFEPEEAEDLAPLDGEAHLIDRGEVAEAAGQVARGDHRLVVEHPARGGICESAASPAAARPAAAR